METPITIVNLIPCRLSPTQPFSERLPTYYGYPPIIVLNILAQLLFLLFFADDIFDGITF
ncbi:MAG: hypothetical protein LBK82_10975 [Planctomycetaceae bacterium]|nr:hypothetical protein [Planctomycetaceae bacterium]